MNQAIRNERLRRQGLIQPFDKAAYESFFRDVSPVMTRYWTMPGDPPLFTLRADFDERRHNELLRSNRTIVKGRFVKGNVGYVYADQLGHFKALYQKKIERVGGLEHQLLELLRHEEALSIGQIKDITGLLAKDIAPMLHRLQEAFLVYEDQRDGDWERRFFLFESEFPEAFEDATPFEDALDQAVKRTLHRLLEADEAMILALLGIAKAPLKDSLARLLAFKSIVRSKDGYLLFEDRHFTEDTQAPIRSTLCLHRNDPLVRSHQPLFAKRKKIEGADCLYHILLDGTFVGYVRGHFKNGPFVFEAFVVDASIKIDSQRSVELERALETIDSAYVPGSIPLVYEDLT